MTNQEDFTKDHQSDTLDQNDHLPASVEKSAPPIPLIWRIVAVAIAAAIIIFLLYPRFNQSDNTGSTEPEPVAVEQVDKAGNDTEVDIAANDSVEDLFQQGQQFYNNSQWDLAISTYKRVIELDPTYQSAYVNLGDAYYQSEQLDLAIETYQRGAEIDPEDADVAYNLGAAFLQQALAGGTPDPDGMAKAIAQIEKAAQLNPDLPHPHYGLGAAYQIMGDFPQAISHFEKFLELDDGSDSRATSEAQAILNQLKAAQSP